MAISFGGSEADLEGFGYSWAVYGMKQPRVRFGREKFWLCVVTCRVSSCISPVALPVSVPTAHPLALSHNGVCDPVHLMHRIERLSI